MKEDRSNTEKWNRAFNAIPRIIGVNRRGGIPEDKMRMLYIRGILRNRLEYVNERDVMRLLQQARDCGASLDSIQNVAKCATSWTSFANALYDFIEKNEGRE